MDDQSGDLPQINSDNVNRTNIAQLNNQSGDLQQINSYDVCYKLLPSITLWKNVYQRQTNFVSKKNNKHPS